MIVLDTSFLISIVRGSPEVSHELQALDYEDLFITSISYFEIFRSRDKVNYPRPKSWACLVRDIARVD